MHALKKGVIPLCYGKEGKKYHIWLILLAALLSLTACGQEERQRGIDGYLYVAEELPGGKQWGTDLKSSDSWLFYREQNTIYRMPLGEDGAPQESGRTALPGGQGMFDYTVDAEGSVYYYAPVITIYSDYTERKGGTLSRYREDGSLDYSLSLEGWSAADITTPMNPGFLAAGDGGKLFLLMGDVVLVVDGQGEIACEIDISALRNSEDGVTEKLMEGEDGKIYYMAAGGGRNLYELAEEDGSYRPRRCSLEGLEGGQWGIGPSFYGSRRGVLYNSTEGILYRYSPSEDAWQAVLRWNDSNLPMDISELLWLSEEKLIAAYGTYQNNGYIYEAWLLDRRREEELPPKEELVMACGDRCSDALEDAVIRFNRSSDRYHITVQLYEEEAWLDAKLVSSDPPDMLVLWPYNVGKYGEKQVLEDLDAYLEGSSALKREDFLEDPLEGYTINGRLVGIPSCFHCSTVRADGLDGEDGTGWRLEDVMAFAENYPERKLCGNHISWTMKNLCGDFIMDGFIDRESGSCSLDTEAFRHMVQWLEAYCGNLDDPYSVAEVEEPLIDVAVVANLLEYIQKVSRPQGGWVSMGYPAADGSRKYHGSGFNALGIVSKSRHKEGAWAFIEYFLSSLEADYGNRGSMPTRRDLMEDILEYAVTPEYVMEDGEICLDRDGNPRMKAKWWASSPGQPEIYYATQEEVDGLLEMIASADFSPEDRLETTVMDIISEELGSYLDGSRPLEEVTRVIQNRVSTAVQESR